MKPILILILLLSACAPQAGATPAPITRPAPDSQALVPTPGAALSTAILDQVARPEAPCAPSFRPPSIDTAFSTWPQNPLVWGAG